MDRQAQLVLPSRVNLPLGARPSFRWAPPAVLALVSALAAQSWFRFGTVVAGGDNTPAGFLDPGGALSAARWIWSTSSTPTGAVDYSATLGAFPALLAGPLALIGIGPAGAQRIFLTLLFASLAPAMFLLLRTLLPRREHLPAVVAGSAFYAFNAGLFFSIPNAVILTSLVLLPLLPALILRGSRSTGWRDPAILAATAIPLGYAFQNPPAATLVLAASLAAAVAGLVAGPRRSATAFLLRSALLGGLVAAWWLVPVALTLLGPSHPAVTSAADPFAWSWTHRRASLGNVLRLTPSWAWPRREYFPYGPVLQRDFFLPLVYLPAALTFAAPLVHRRRRRLALAVAAGAVIAAFLAKGLHPPLSGLNAALYRHVPGMWLFREPSAKFTLLLAGLFAIGIALFVGAFARKAVRWTVVGVVVAATAATTFPIWLGKVVPDSRPLLPSEHVRIPEYWHAAARFIDANPGRTLLLPADGYYQVPYTWGFYGADLIPEQLIHSPVVRLMDKQSYGYLTPDAGAYRLLAELRQALAAARFSDAAQLMDVLSIHWIVLRHDVDASFPGRNLQDPATLAAGFAASDKLRLVRTFGHLDLYELRARERPLVWATSHVLVGSSAAVAAVPGRAAVVDGAALDGAASGVTGHHLFEVDFDTWRWAGSHATVQLQPQPGLYEGLVRWPRGIPLDVSVRTGIGGRALEIRAPEVSVGGRALAPTLTTAVLPLQVSQPQLLSIDGRIVPLSARAETSISVGAGRHRIAVFGRGEPLPVHDASFERGAWGGVGDCSAYDSRTAGEVGLRAERVPGGSAGRFALELAAREHSACVRQRLPGFVGEAAYRISFEYRHLRGAVPRVCVWQQGPARCVPAPALTARPGWQRFEQVFRPAAGTTSLTLHLYADGAPGGSRELYDNVQLERLAPPPDFVLVPVLSQGGAPASGPTIRVLHSDPSSYRVQVRDARRPFLLALDETFDPGWELDGLRGAPHMRVNGYANGWLIHRRGTFELTLRYGAQHVVDVSRLASAAGLVAVAAWLFGLRLLRARRLRRSLLAGGPGLGETAFVLSEPWRTVHIGRHNGVRAAVAAPEEASRADEGGGED